MEEPIQHFKSLMDERNALSSYISLSFALFLASLPTKSLSLVPNLHSQITTLSLRLFQAEDQLRQIKSRRKEDSKANARVVEIFASHRNSWQAEERKLLEQVDSLQENVKDLERARKDAMCTIQDLQRKLVERDEMIGFMSRNTKYEENEEGHFTREQVEDNSDLVYPQAHQDQLYMPGDRFDLDFMASASKFWAETSSPWQDVQYESLESLYHLKHFVARESPWKVDSEATGIPAKLKLLEQQLLNMEIIGKSEPNNAPLLTRKQAKRYQVLAGKINDLCRRMEASDPCEATVSPEFRTQRQTEFLIEAFRLQQLASETGQELLELQVEIGESCNGYEPERRGKVTTRRSLESIRYNLKEIQRNVEIWLARIIGDLEGIMSRDGASRDYYIANNLG